MEYIVIAAAPAEDNLSVWYYIYGLGWTLFPQVLICNKIPLKIDIVILEKNIARLKWQAWNVTTKSWYDVEISYEEQLSIVQNLEKHNKLHYYHFN